MPCTVDCEGWVQQSLAGAQVGNVTHEFVSEDGAREVAGRHVGTGPGFGIGNRDPFLRVGRAAAYLQLGH